MGQFEIGQSLPRTEDPRLLMGAGRYTDDHAFPNQAYAVFVRSPHAHADIKSIDTNAAQAAPGVIKIVTGTDYEAAGLGGLRCNMPRQGRDGKPMFQPPHSLLMKDRVRMVGDPVAMVMAETLAQAKDAAELVEVDYAPLAAITATADAMNPDAPTVWDECPDNECFFAEIGDRAATDAAFEKAAHIVKHRLTINRITANAMEPRGCVALFDTISERFTVYSPLQTPHSLRHSLAEEIFHLPDTRFRIIGEEVGGGFGMRGGNYPETPLVAWAAQLTGRPVRWICERSEGLATDNHARDNVTDAELALDSEGNFLGLRIRTLANLGAYLAAVATLPPVLNLGTLAGVYTTPAINVQVSGVFTNTNQTGPYRGAGRPEAAYVIERMIDKAAFELGIDRVEIRRRNVIPADAMPYKTGLVFTYDCGEFEKNMDAALAMADWNGFEARRAEALKRGKLRGLGIANPIEQSAGGAEVAEVRFDPSGAVTIVSGSHDHGQGHDVTFKQVLSDKLGIDSERINYLQGDTDIVPFGTGTFGSRSATLAGSAIVTAADKLIAKGKRIAAHILEASESDIEFDKGQFTIAGTDRSVAISDVAKLAFNAMRLPRDIEPGFHEIAGFNAGVQNFPNGCHVCELEIDEDTGEVEIVEYNVADDVGTVINPLLLKGQIHGGVAQGLGQALMEDLVYDPESGQLLSGSFMDYCMPKADDMPYIEVKSMSVPTKTNPLGVKGAGEAGTVGALPAVMNGVVDALAPLGIDHIDMPATPERIWQAMQKAKAANGGQGVSV